MPASSSRSPSQSLALLVPVFNDWDSLACLLRLLDAMAQTIEGAVTVIVVDDGSTCGVGPDLGLGLDRIDGVEVVRLRCNLGHQRAIAIGLAECVRQDRFNFVVVLDADGEDRPEEIPGLLDAALRNPGAVVEASRARRSEGVAFRLAYRLYKTLFHLLTGRTIDFGNFCVLPIAAVRRLVCMPEAWNHLAATIVKSRLPLVRLPTERGVRLCGRSSMNLVSLVIHGFSAFSVFIETAITRLLLFFGCVSLSTAGTAAAVVGLRLCTDLAIPGWATNAFGFSLVLFFQALTLALVGLFSVLGSRSAVPFLVGQQGECFVDGRRVLWRKGNG